MESDSFGALTGVTSLQHLALDHALLPDSLHQLAWLRSLHIEAMEREGGVMPGLEEALPALRHLTALALCFVPLWRPGLMAALDARPRLRRLVVCSMWDGYSSDCGHRNRLPPANLPVLPLLGQLEAFGSDGDLLLRNPQLLEAAPQLQHLWLMGHAMRRHCYERAWRRFIRWAQHQQQLRSISLRPSYDGFPAVPFDITGDQWDDLLALLQHRPEVVLHNCPSELRDMTMDEMWMPLFAEAAS